MKASDMATGLVTVIQHEAGQEKVMMKIATATGGPNTHVVASAVHKLRKVPDARNALELAKEAGFGSQADLIVVTEAGIMAQADPDFLTEQATLLERARNTFGNPLFNPFDPNGQSEYLIQVHLP